MSKNILVLIPVNNQEEVLLEEKAPLASFVYENKKTVTKDLVVNANIIIGNPPPKLIKGSKNLEWLQLNSSGADAYLEEGVLPQDVILTNASGAYGLVISEYMIAVLLSIYKNLHYYRDNQFAHEWKYEGGVKTIKNARTLILGLGDIGSEFGKKMKALGAYTIGIRRTNAPKPNYLDEMYLMNDFESLLPRADIIALCLPATSLTNKIINKKTISLMKNDAVIINVGRGSAVDTDALADALKYGHLLGAALDVVDPEPLPADHRLWKTRNVIITPHISGGYSLEEVRNTIIRIASENLESFLMGKQMKNIVDFSVSY